VIDSSRQLSLSANFSSAAEQTKSAQAGFQQSGSEILPGKTLQKRYSKV